MRIKSAPIGSVILILATAGQGEHVRLIEHPYTPKGGELGVPEKRQ